MSGRKSRHYRDESDSLLNIYSTQIEATTSLPSYGNPVSNINISPTKFLTRANSDISAFSGLSFVDDDDDNNNNNYEEGDEEKQRKQQQQQHDKRLPKKKKKHRANRYKVHRVSYTPQNHVQVLFQMYGSAFPQVFPFCLLNFFWTLAVVSLKKHDVVDLTFHSSVGHSFMGLLVSFLLVSRSKISYDRFMDFRRNLARAYKACREVVQFTTVFTFQTQTPKAKEWRNEVCYRTILLLRVTMDALLWSSTEREKWEEEYFQYDKRLDDHQVSEHFLTFRSLTHGRRSRIDENFRAPISFSHVLRQVIMEHPEYLGYKMPVNEYRDLLYFVGKFQDAFHEFRVLIFTPYPFPLVQMTRAFLLFWVYSLPLVLLKEYRVGSSLVIVMLVTFGFIGVEYVSMALDDPFGDDTNDVDEHGMALLVYEDIYLTIYRTDGPQAACKLRERVLDRYRQGRGLDCYRNDLKGYAFWEPLGEHRREDDDYDDDSAPIV